MRAGPTRTRLCSRSWATIRRRRATRPTRLSPPGRQVRMNELNDAINVLNATCPHLVTYLDAGAGDAVPARQTANLLRRAGISQSQGFFLNATHYDWTSNELRFGEKVS